MPRRQRILQAQARWDEKRGHWRVNAQNEGARRTFYSSIPGNAGKRDCEAKAEEWLQSRTSGEQMRLEDALDAWLAVVKAQTSVRNHKQYESYVRLYFKPFFAPYRARQLTAQMLDDCVEYAFQNSVTGKPLSEKTLKNMRGALTGWLKYMRKANITNLRLDEAITINRNATPKRPKRILQFADIRKLFSSELDDEKFVHFYRLLLLTGCRPSELLGVQEANITDDRINIMGGLDPDGTPNKGKNRTAIRVIPLDDRMRAEISAERSAKRAAGYISPWLFPHVSVHTMYDAWCAMCKRHGITQTSLYGLRHTNISLNKRTPDEYLKLRVGHTDSMDTRGVYSHELEDDVKQAGAYNTQAFDEVLVK